MVSKPRLRQSPSKREKKSLRDLLDKIIVQASMASTSYFNIEDKPNDLLKKMNSTLQAIKQLNLQGINDLASQPPKI